MHRDAQSLRSTPRGASATTAEARITGLNHRGEGVGKVVSGPDQGLVVFIAGTVPGDLVEYSTIERKKSFMRGKVVRLLEEGRGRIAEACPVASLCGGCTWQHISYDIQLEWKRRIVEDSLARIARISDCEVRPCIPSPQTLGYRNKVEVPLADDRGRIVAGFFEPYTHRVVPSDECPLEHPLAREIVVRAVEEIRRRKYAVYNERTGRGLVRHVVARVAPGTDERMAVLVANSRALPGETDLAHDLAASLPDLKSVVLNTNMQATNIILGEKNKLLLGRPYIEDLLGGGDLSPLKFRISPHSFYQVNAPQAVRLYKEALNAASITSGDVVYDVYSGIGTITLFAAKKAALAVGIEEVGDAVRDARKNASENHIENVRFREGKAERILPAVIRDHGRPDVVIMDPPRGGCEEPALVSVSKARPRSIIYVSCNPATLARDLITLGREGWRPTLCQPLDMFPMTPHVETVVKMERAYPSGYSSPVGI